MVVDVRMGCRLPRLRPTICIGGGLASKRISSCRCFSKLPTAGRGRESLADETAIAMDASAARLVPSGCFFSGEIQFDQTVTVFGARDDSTARELGAGRRQLAFAVNDYHARVNQLARICFFELDVVARHVCVCLAGHDGAGDR